MAEMNFVLLSIQTSLKQKSVFIECSLDIDEDTIDANSIIILDKTKSTIELYDSEVDGHLIQARLKNDPQPGDKYTILVQDTIKSIVGDKLEEAIFREIAFDSEVTSDVNILSPANFEKVHATKISWEEKGEHPVNSFDVQVAKENVFYNIVTSSKVTGQTEVEFPDLPDGQYYVRCRAAKGDDYGRWSNVITFLYSAPETTPEPPTDDKEKDPTIVDPPSDDGSLIIDDVVELTLDEPPTNGVTPKDSFTFAFSEDINIDDAEIKVYRSDF